MNCTRPGCTSVATEEVNLSGQVSGIFGTCKACHDDLMENWERLRQDAQTLRNQGVSQKMLDRIMKIKIDKGVYGN